MAWFAAQVFADFGSEPASVWVIPIYTGTGPPLCILGLIWSIYRFIRARSPSPRPWAPRWRAISTVTLT